MQYERHPVDGRVLITEDQIKAAMARTSIRKHAYIPHGKDRVTEEEVAEFPSLVACTLKPPHLHGVTMSDDTLMIDQLAGWLAIESQYVRIPNEITNEPTESYRGAFAKERAFFDLCQYLTHEHPKQQAAGKYRYPDSDVRANFDFRAELDAYLAKRSNNAARSLSSAALDGAILDVMEGRKTLKQLRFSDPVLYGRNLSRFQALRRDHLANQAPPDLRVNYYFDGAAGAGKTQLARLFARTLFPQLPSDECYFEIGQGKVALQDYDGQPVVIWDDMRAVDIIMALGDRGTAWRAFDTSPGRSRVNVKYGSMALAQSVNIVTRIESRDRFFTELAGQYKGADGRQHEAEDMVQAYRRFPFAAEVSEDEVLWYANQGFAGTGEYQSYVAIARMTANMRQVISIIENVKNEAEREQVRREIGAKMLNEMVLAHRNARPPRSLTGAAALKQLEGQITVAGRTEIEAEAAADALADEEALIQLEASTSPPSPPPAQSFRVEMRAPQEAAGTADRAARLAKLREAGLDLAVLAPTPDPWAI